MKQLTVRSVRREVKVRGYTDPDIQDVQQLGYRGMFGRFVVLEEEVVPSEVKIEIGAFGTYDGPWRSKFINWIPKSRGGNADG